MLLNLELVPSTSWYSNVRQEVSNSEWRKIRSKVLEEYGHKCGICEATNKLAAHEIWHYDMRTGVQTLQGMIALCPDCHHVKHFGFAQILASQGKLDLGRIIKHFCRINQCTEQEMEQHIRESFALWEKQSRKKWTLDISALQKYLPSK